MSGGVISAPVSHGEGQQFKSQSPSNRKGYQTSYGAGDRMITRYDADHTAL